MTKPETVLQIEELCVNFVTRRGTARVLNNISLHVNRGESLGIVGESGCGKSMTALSVMRLIPLPGRISHGRVLFQGSDLLTLSDGQMEQIRGKGISMIFQEPMTALNPVFTIGWQIAETIQCHEGMNRTQAFGKTLEILQSVGIPAPERRIRQYPHELSGGMRQRVMIAMALSCRPSLLIADEPTTALDVTIQAQILDLLLEIQSRTNTAILLITHNMGVIAEMCQRVIVMYAGHIVEEGSVDQVLYDPQHPYTQGLLQCVPSLQADPGPDRRELAEIPGVVPDLSQLSPGCPFRERCRHPLDPCAERMPPMNCADEGHYFACWFAR